MSAEHNSGNRDKEQCQANGNYHEFYGFFPSPPETRGTPLLAPSVVPFICAPTHLVLQSKRKPARASPSQLLPSLSAFASHLVITPAWLISTKQHLIRYRPSRSDLRDWPLSHFTLWPFRIAIGTGKRRGSVNVPRPLRRFISRRGRGVLAFIYLDRAFCLRIHFFPFYVHPMCKPSPTRTL